MQVSRLLLYYDPSSYIYSPNSKFGTYGNTRISEDIIFDESVIFDKHIDNSPTDEEFAALPHAIENINDGKHEKVNIWIRYRDKDGNEGEHVPEPQPVELLDSVPIGRNISPPLEIYSPQDYKDLHPGNEDNSVDSLPIVPTDTSE